MKLRKIASKTANAVQNELSNLKGYFGGKFNQVFKSITSDNGFLRRFIPKGTAINNYSSDEIAFIEEWCNRLPRKILGYRTPEELFEKQLDMIYGI